MPVYPRTLAVGFVVALSLGLASCDDTPVATTVPPPPPTRPTTGPTLSGVVYDHTSTGMRPRANVSLLVREYATNAFTTVTSDATGRYSLSGVQAGQLSIAAKAGSGYVSPCPSGSDGIQSDAVMDVHVVSEALASTTGVPDDLPLGTIWVSGVVYERTQQGTQPVAGATVLLDGHSPDPRFGSTTLTNAAGFYLVCPPIPGTGTDVHVYIRASRAGYLTVSRTAVLGYDYGAFDLELIRN